MVSMTAEPASSKPRLVFIANTMYSSVLSGGDVHTLNMAESALRAGYQIHFLAGHALKAELEKRKLPVTVTVTDRGIMSPRDFGALSGQLALLANNFERLRGTLAHLKEIRPDDLVYINTDFWWDVLPGMFCKARRRLMILGMDCPTLWEIIRKARPDVAGIRLPSVHYWMSQHLALRLFRRCRPKRLLYVHPNQKPRLRRAGYREEELIYVSNGMDLRRIEAVPAQPKLYDAVWIGRIHRQKGVDDLVATVAHLAARIKNFRAMIIGNVRQVLEERFRELGVAANVEFSGFVSEEEKIRLLKASRIFLMPSRYESWGIVIAEALACGVPVVAYELDAYRPVFGALVNYVKPFDVEAFKQAAAAAVERGRAGQGDLPADSLEHFKRENSWEMAGTRFLSAVSQLEAK
jgi:glycosyltransferase involved in cell wall biosynthesis